jgi:hypothetical protein
MQIKARMSKSVKRHFVRGQAYYEHMRRVANELDDIMKTTVLPKG